MINEEKIMESVEFLFEDMGLQSEEIDIIVKYFNDEIDEENCFSNINTRKNMDDLPYISYNHLNMVKKIDSILNKFMKLVFHIGRESTLESYSIYSFIENDSQKAYEQFLDWNVPYHYYIIKKANLEDRYYSYIKKDLTPQYQELYLIDRNEFIQAVRKSEGSTKRFLAATVVNNKDELSDEFKELLQKDMKEFLNIILVKAFQKNNRAFEDTKRLINDYLDGKEEKYDTVLTNLTGKLEGVKGEEIFNLIALAYYTKDSMEISKKIFKIFVDADYKVVLSAIMKYISGERDNIVYYDSYKVNEKIYYSFEEVLSFAKEIDISNVNIIHWMINKVACGCDKAYKVYFLENFNDNEVLKEVYNLCNDREKLHIVKYICKEQENSEKRQHAEAYCIKSFTKYLLKVGATKKQTEDFYDYISGEKELNKIEKAQIDINNYYNEKHRSIIRNIVCLEKISPIFNKILRYMFYLRNDNLLELIMRFAPAYSEDTTEEFIENLDNAGIELLDRIVLYANKVGSNEGSNINEIEKSLTKAIKDNQDLVIDNLSQCIAAGRIYLLKVVNKLINENNEAYDKFIKNTIEMLGDGSKAVRNEALAILENRGFNEELLLPLLENKKALVREMAVKALKGNMNEKVKTILGERLEKDRSDKVKDAIAEVLNISNRMEEQGDIVNVEDFCSKNINKRKASKLQWLELEGAPVLKVKESDRETSKEVMQYIIIAVSEEKEIKISEVAKNVAQFIDESSLSEMALYTLNKWIDDGAEAKKKWILSLCAMFGDMRVVDILHKNIKKWAEHSRSAIACQGVKALALQGSDDAIMIVDSISRKFKFKQVKKAAKGALEFAAKELGIDPEELSDRIIPNYDFDKNGEKIFDYGNRKFIVQLDEELKLKVYKEDGKALKNLPAVGKNDDENMAVKAKEEFKILKKQLKNLVSVQSERLELALSASRKWTFEKWQKVFVDNIIMNKFAVALIWGVYEGDKLVNSFRYMEDGTFNTSDEEEYTPAENVEIGLVHPVELSKEELELWKEQLQDYEIVQPFSQIERKIFEISEEEMKMDCIERFGGIQVSDMGLLGKMTKAAWYKGSVQDAGMFYDFYKENSQNGIGAELHMSGMYVAGEFEDVTIYEIQFYNAGTVERGSYVYDTIKKEHLIKPIDVPKRFFSEILYDIDKATSTNLGTDENWKANKY